VFFEDFAGIVVSFYKGDVLKAADHLKTQRDPSNPGTDFNHAKRLHQAAS